MLTLLSRTPYRSMLMASHDTMGQDVLTIVWLDKRQDLSS